MIHTSTTETEAFTPSWREGEPDAPVFRLRAGSVIERGQLEAELAGPHRCGRVMGYDLIQAIRDGVALLLADNPGLDRVQGLIEAEAAGETDDFDDDDRELLVEVRKVLAEHFAPYRELIAQIERRNQIAPVVALRRFCVDWENVRDDSGEPVAFARGRDGQVTEAALAGVPWIELMVAGQRAYGKLYTSGQEKNLPRPSPSDDGPQTSPSDAMSTEAGKSATTSGRKTPGSRSRPKSGRS